MSLFDFLENLFSDTESHVNDINPANGLPMIDDSIDVNGNPFGTDFNDQSSFDNSGFDDHNDFGGGGFGGFD